MHCARCGTDNPTNSRFCNACGNALGQFIADPSGSPALGGGERRRATVLFADLTGFTPLCERLDPEEVRELMGQVFGEASRIILGFGGVVEKYIGDAVMAVFGSNQASEDDALRAVRSARQFRQFVRGLNARHPGHRLDVHSGINTGLIVTGQITPQAGAVGVVGDAVNVAARLSDAAEAGEILLGEETALQVERFFHVEPLPSLAIKGKSDAVRVCRLGEPRAQPSATRRLAGVHAALVGREVESAFLKRALDRLRDGKGSILALRGEAGLGKSRLVEEFRVSLPENFRWLAGVAYDHTRGIPYQPVIDLLGRVWAIQESDSPAMVREKFEGQCRLLLPEPETRIPYLGALYALDYPQVAGEAPEYRQARLEEALLALFEAMARQAPSVFFLEDMHWADPSTVALVRRLLSGFRVPAIVVCAYRPPFHLFEPGAGIEGYQELALEALSRTQVTDLVEALLEGSAPTALLDFVLERADGNPFFVEELLNALIGLEVLRRAEGGWRLEGDLGRVDLPGTLQGVIAARLDRVDAPSRRLLQEAAVIGQRFLVEVLHRITTLSEDLHPRLEMLEGQDLIRAGAIDPDLEYLFKHPLTREVVYQSLLLRERRMIHERVGRAIEAVLVDRLPEYYERLAHHFLHGSSRLKAADYLIKAGNKALARYALEEAGNYFRRGFELLTAEQARSPAESALLFDLFDQWAKVFYFQGAMRELNALLDPLAEEVARLGDPARESMFHAWRSCCLFFQSRLHASEAAVRKAIVLAEQSGDRRVLAYALTWLCQVCAYLSKFDEGIRAGERAAELADGFPDDDYLPFKSRAMVGFNHWQRGDAARTIEHGEKLVEFGRKHANPRSELLGFIVLTNGYLEAGDVNAALRAGESAVAVSRDRFYDMAGGLVLGLVRTMQGLPDPDFEGVRAFFARASDWLDCFCGVVLGLRCVQDGRYAEALRWFDASEAWYESVDNHANAEHVRLIKGRFYLHMATGPRPAMGVMVRNLGFVARHALTAARRAEALLLGAAEFYGATQAMGRRAQALLALGTLYRYRGRGPEAARCLDEACEIFERVGAHAFLQQARSERDAVAGA
jgi:class 3 adenylate cyclase/tetratricopeptide (TPR) repeat protein